MPFGNVRPKPVGAIQLDYAHPSALDLVGAWVLGEGSGGAFNDSSRLRQPVTAATPPTWVGGGRGGSCLAFSAGSEFSVTRLGGNRFTAANSIISVVAIVKPTTGCILGLGAKSDSNGWWNFGYDGTNIGLSTAYGNGVTTLTTTADQWSVVGVSQTAANARTYMANGAIATNTFNGGTDSIGSTQPFVIGTGYNGAGAFDTNACGIRYTGRIEAVFVWARALKQTELLAFSVDPYTMFYPIRTKRRFKGSAGGPTNNTNSLTGQTALTATRQNAVAHLMNATTGITATFSKSVSRPGAGSTALAATIAKASGKGFAAATANTATRANAVTHGMTATTALTATRKNDVAKPLAATETPSGNLTSQVVISQTLAGTMTPTATISKATGHGAPASTALTATRQNAVARGMTATTAISGTLAKTTGRAFAAATALTAAIAKSVNRNAAASVTLTATIARAVAKFIASTLNPSGSLGTQYTPGGGGGGSIQRIVDYFRRGGRT